ncbi:hypothetical protein FGB62_83g03 [Gracilaria domingensis]|nr:hypothetical protein FGB62_83g03 [Gracilaria domingensis]
MKSPEEIVAPLKSTLPVPFSTEIVPVIDEAVHVGGPIASRSPLFSEIVTIPATEAEHKEISLEPFDTNIPPPPIVPPSTDISFEEVLEMPVIEPLITALPEESRDTLPTELEVSIVSVAVGEFADETNPLTVVVPESRISPDPSPLTLPRISVAPKVESDPLLSTVTEPVTKAPSRVHDPPLTVTLARLPLSVPEHIVWERHRRGRQKRARPNRILGAMVVPERERSRDEWKPGW